MPLDPEAIQARSEALIGEVLGDRYRLDAVLGIGAMGAVFRAFHTGLEREVAIKLLHRQLMASDEMRARFSREAAAISKLDHPNCVRVSDFGSDDDYQYLVMEFLQGTTLSAELDRPLSPLRAIELTDQVLAGLEHAHGHGLVHRDIKPDNIFLVRDEGGRSRAKLLDFGIVKLQEQEGKQQLTQVGMIFGTPHFMSPEQAMGSDVDVRTDLYATGIVLYTMLAGGLPFDSDDPVKVLRAQINDEPPPLPERVPAVVREIVARMIAKKPDERYESATAAREALAAARQILDPTFTPAEAPGAPTPGLEAGSGPLLTNAAAADAPGAGATESPSGTESPPGTKSPPGTGSPPSGEAASASPPAEMPSLPGRPVPQAASPALVVPSISSTSWWPPPKPVWWAAAGLGGLALVVILAVSGGDDEAKPATSEPASADAARSGLASLLGKDENAEGKREDPTPAEDEDLTIEDEDGAESAGDTSGGPDYAVIDALIDAREFKGARISLETSLGRYPQEAGLHWRMAKVLTALGGADNRKAALRSYSAAITADATMLDDEAFLEGMKALIQDPKLRIEAVDLAIEHLGTRLDDELVQWLNVQGRPLPYASRQRIITHLQEHERGDEINRPLQRAHDLWQARDADDPCRAFAKALDEASHDPESYLVGTLRRVSVPTAGGPDAEGEACPGLAEKLEQVRTRHDTMFAGIDATVPKAYRKRRR